MYGDLKIAFVQHCLQNYMQDVIKAMQREIIRRKVRVTDDLLKSLSYNVYQQDAQGNATLSFAEWGRYVDMGVGRGHPLGGVNATKELVLSKSKKSVTRNPKKIYSPIAYGKLNGLIGDLMYGFTEETIALIKKQLDANTNTDQRAA